MIEGQLGPVTGRLWRRRCGGGRRRAARGAGGRTGGVEPLKYFLTLTVTTACANNNYGLII